MHIVPTAEGRKVSSTGVLTDSFYIGQEGSQLVTGVQLNFRPDYTPALLGLLSKAFGNDSVRVLELKEPYKEGKGMKMTTVRVPYCIEFRDDASLGRFHGTWEQAHQVSYARLRRDMFRHDWESVAAENLRQLESILGEGPNIDREVDHYTAELNKRVVAVFPLNKLYTNWIHNASNVLIHSRYGIEEVDQCFKYIKLLKGIEQDINAAARSQSAVDIDLQKISETTLP